MKNFSDFKNITFTNLKMKLMYFWNLSEINATIKSI